MKNTKNILFMVVIVAVMGLQIGYLLTTYQDDMSTINGLSKDLEDNKRYLKQLQERVAMLPETKKELELMTAQKNAMLSTIPLFDAVTKQIVEMTRYIGLKNIINLEIGYSIEPAEDADKSIYAQNYELTMVGRYNDIRDIVDGLNSSYQIVNISEFIIDNKIQSVGHDMNLGQMTKFDYEFKEAFNDDYVDVVEAKINFTIYSRASYDAMDEIYDPDFNMYFDKKDIFKLKQEGLSGEDNQVSPSVGTNNGNQTTTTTTPTPSKNYDKFTLNIGDVFTSGDTYKLGGPKGYVGLISKANTEIKLTINNAGYDMSIKDANGQEKTTHVDVDIVDPKLSIISTMRQLEDVMPSIHVYVHNYTGRVMEVDLEGSMLGNIHIFNESNKEVQKGQSSGNIKVS